MILPGKEEERELHCNIVTNVPEEDGDDDVRRTELWQVALRGHDLHNGLPAKVAVEVLRDDDGDGEVLAALMI